MTISLEEHVARAIAALKCDNVMEEDQHGCIASGSCHCLDYARDAIAAVRQHDAMKCGWPDCDCGGPDNVPQRCKEPVSIRESERAACEAIIEEQINLLRRNGAWGFSELQNVQHKIAARKGKGEGK